MKRLLIELLIISVIIIVATPLSWQVIYPALGLPDYGPTPLRTILVWLAVLMFVSRSGESWKSYGMQLPFQWYWLIPFAFSIMLGKYYLMQPLSDWLKGLLNLPMKSDYSFFAHLEGNVPALIIWIIIVWIAAGFAEEMIFRGYLQNKISEHIKNKRFADVIAVGTQALLFGSAHYYSNAGSMLTATITGLFFGSCFLIFRKSLWPLILAHGAWDTLGMIHFYQDGP